MQDIAATTRQVILYRAPVPNSFASLSAHGAIFLNVPVDANEVFFLEDIAHQSAHVIFNAMTLRKEHFFTVDPYTPVAKITGNQDEPRHLYTVFHALFTYTKICRVLSKLHSCCYFSGRHAHELTGRLGFSLKKFEYDLRCLNNRALFTRAGWFFYRRFTDEYAQYMTQYGHLTHLDFSDQPYNFSYREFALINPLNLPVEEVSLS
jgi:hypothetical protein